MTEVYFTNKVSSYYVITPTRFNEGNEIKYKKTHTNILSDLKTRLSIRETVF